ncbi:MAG: hypothetical protein KIH89_002300 [Candidatus Shapirobacteria bacterium]|nr:hypothetical protein [Candidatus Shapirobacteria bacterium]
MVERLSPSEFAGINFSQTAELHYQPDFIKKINPDRTFILLLGPSAIGKSTLIKAVNQQTNNSLEYISPYTTRPLRDGETDKISVDNSTFDILESSGSFIRVNHLYGVRYGTPLAPILHAFEFGRIPILDFPLDKTSELVRPDYDLFNIYLFPETSDLWMEKLSDCGRNTNGRLESGIDELTMLHQMSSPHPDIHCSMVNNYKIETAAARLLEAINRVKKIK